MENLPLVVENIILDRKAELEHVHNTEQIHKEFSEIYESCQFCDSCRKKDDICRGCIVNTGVYNDWLRWKQRLENDLEANDLQPFAREFASRRRKETYEKIKTFEKYISYQIRENLGDISCEEFNELVETDRLRRRFLYGGFGAYGVRVIFITAIGRGTGGINFPTYEFDKITHTLIVFYPVPGKYDFFPKPLINRIPYKKRIYKFCII